MLVICNDICFCVVGNGCCHGVAQQKTEEVAVLFQRVVFREEDTFCHAQSAVPDEPVDQFLTQQWSQEHRIEYVILEESILHDDGETEDKLSPFILLAWAELNSTLNTGESEEQLPHGNDMRNQQFRVDRSGHGWQREWLSEIHCCSVVGDTHSSTGHASLNGVDNPHTWWKFLIAHQHGVMHQVFTARINAREIAVIRSEELMSADGTSVGFCQPSFDARLAEDMLTSGSHWLLVGFQTNDTLFICGIRRDQTGVEITLSRLHDRSCEWI